MQIRSCPHPVALDTRDAKPGSAGNLSGYIAVFNSDSEDLGGYVEQIQPGAFSTLAKNDVVALVNHNYDRVVGRVSAGTLALREDDTGLAFDLAVPDTEAGRDLLTLVGRGDLKGCSFGFKIDASRWEMRDGKDLCILEAIDLYECSVGVTFPAYGETSMSLRSELNTRRQAQRDKARARLRFLSISAR